MVLDRIGDFLEAMWVKWGNETEKNPTAGGGR